MSKREKELLTKIRALEEERRIDQLEICNLKCQVEVLMGKVKAAQAPRVDMTFDDFEKNPNESWLP